MKIMIMAPETHIGAMYSVLMQEEELEEEKVELPINRALEKAKKKSKVNGEPISISNESEKRPSIESLPEQENPAKRQKVDDTNPPPPSAEQVIKQKRKEESRKARNSRGPSASPAPSTPPATGNDMENSNGLTDELFLQIIDAKSKEFTIPELILDLTSHGHDVHSPDIQRRMKQLMRKYLNHNKSTHTLTRK